MTYVTANLSFAVEPVGEQYSQMTLLKITAAEIDIANGFERKPQKLYGGWVKAGEASTVGKLKKGGTDDYYLGAAAGMDVFSLMFVAFMDNAPTIGFQTSPNGLDRTLSIPRPMSPETLVAMENCLSTVKRSIPNHTTNPK